MENNRVKTMIIKFFNAVFYAKNIMALFFAFFLFGCEMSSGLNSSTPNTSSSISTQPVTLTPATIEPQPAVKEARTETYDAEGDKLQMCQSQLEALKPMNPVKYAQMRKSFDYLMNGAAQYSDIRQKTNADTKDTVDALYRYRANLLCAQIAQTLLDGLTRRGEARP